MKNRASVNGWQKLFSSYKCSQLRRPLQSLIWDIRLKILGLGNFNMPFQLVLTKLNCFRVYRKLIAWKSWKEPIVRETSEPSFEVVHYNYVPVKSKLQHFPPPPGIPRAFDTFAVPGRREFDYQSLPGSGEFDPHALGVGNLNCTLDFM